MDLYVILGLVLLILTCWNYWKQKTDAITLFFLFISWICDWWWGIDDISVSKDNFPLFYQICLIAQAVAGVALIIYGLLT